MGGAIFKVLKKYRVPLIHTVHDYRMVCPAYTFKNGRGELCEKCKPHNYYHCILNRCNKGSLVQSFLMSVEMYLRQCCFYPLKNIDGFLFVSKFAERKHIDCNKNFIKNNNLVLYNYTIPVLERYITKKSDYFLFFGRLSYEKGIKTLIEVFGAVSSQKLKVVGTGPLEEELKALCNRNNWTNIEFVGYKSGRILYELVRDAKYECVSKYTSFI